MKSKIVAVMSITGLLLLFGMVFAYYHEDVRQEPVQTNTLESLKEQREQLQQGINEQIEVLRQQQEELRQQIQERRQTLQGLSPLSREEMLKRAKEHIEEFKTERDRMRQEAQERKEEYEARAKELREAAKEEIEKRKQEFREELAQLKEERHKALAEKLSEQMNRVNQNISNAALNYLDAHELVLSKIEARTGIIEEATGTDLTQVREAIVAARQKIQEARTAVLSQKSKEYVMTIDPEKTLGQNIRNAFQELRNDHKQLRQEVLRPLRNLIRDIALTLKTAAQQAGEEAQKALEEDFEEEQGE